MPINRLFFKSMHMCATLVFGHTLNLMESEISLKHIVRVWFFSLQFFLIVYPNWNGMLAASLRTAETIAT